MKQFSSFCVICGSTLYPEQLLLHTLQKNPSTANDNLIKKHAYVFTVNLSACETPDNVNADRSTTLSDSNKQSVSLRFMYQGNDSYQRCN